MPCDVPRTPPNPFIRGEVLEIDAELIARVVADFYASVRADQLLGPIFAAHIEDWPAHLGKLEQFWSSLVLQTPGYKGTPMQAHLDLGDITPAHFEHWLMLFEATLERHCTPEQAELFMDRARRIAQSFQFAIARARGEMPGRPALTRN